MKRGPESTTATADSPHEPWCHLLRHDMIHRCTCGYVRPEARTEEALVEPEGRRLPKPWSQRGAGG